MLSRCPDQKIGEERNIHSLLCVQAENLGWKLRNLFHNPAGKD